MKLLESLGIYADLPTEYLKDRYSDADSKFMNVGEVEVHYKDEGTGQPIILLHGIASSIQTWDGWSDRLKRSFRVIRLDLPGAGLSSLFPKGSYRISEYVDFLAEFIRALELKKVVLVGNSMGGIICWHFAVKYPEMVSKMILIDAGGYFRGKLSVVRFGRLPLLGNILRYFSPKFFLKRSLREVYGNPSLVSVDLVQRYHDLLRKSGNRSALIRRIRADWVFDPQPIQSIKIDTLLLWGELDRVLSTKMADLYRRDIANSKLIVFPGLGHTPMEEDPQLTAGAAIQFLNP